jgi:hypothetical protein
LWGVQNVTEETIMRVAFAIILPILLSGCLSFSSSSPSAPPQTTVVTPAPAQ